MGLEATMVCLDNSEWMRNGDYTPTRMEAQHDAANLVCGTKLQQNPQSTVGVLTMAGNGVEVLSSPTTDVGKILSACSGVEIGGRSQFAAGLQIAHLALKHRKEKNGSQRIVIFVGSPVLEDEKKLTKIAKSLKKSNVNVDIVSMGESDENEAKLQAFIEKVNKNNSSHLVTIPAGVLPSDVLITSAIITGDESGAAASGAAAAGGAGAFAEYGGVDPNLDPELALALRVSIESAKKEAEARHTVEGDNKEGEASAPAETEAKPDTSKELDDDAELQKALLMSMGGAQSTQDESNDMEEEMDEELQRALAMSTQQSTPAPDKAKPPSAPKKEKPSNAEEAQQIQDPDFVNQLLSGISGIDTSDPRLQQFLAPKDEDEKEKDKKKKDKDGK